VRGGRFSALRDAGTDAWKGVLPEAREIRPVDEKKENAGKSRPVWQKKEKAAGLFPRLISIIGGKGYS
jgi:hypothetical protein